MILTLASASPRRKQLLSQLGYEFDIAPADIDEINCGDVDKIVEHNAQNKALKIFNLKSGIVLGSDTIVTLDNKILSKPKNKIQAHNMFRMLCGRTHTVVTGIFIIGDRDINGNLYPNVKKMSKNEKTYVTFGAFNEEIVYNYIQSGAPFDKAGGYGLQDEMIKSLIVNVEGDRNNVIGLPIGLVDKILKENFT